MREGSLLNDHLHLRPEKVNVVQITKNAALFERTLENLRTRRNDSAICAYLNHHGYRLDAEGMDLLRKAVANSFLQAKEHLLKLSTGDYRRNHLHGGAGCQSFGGAFRETRRGVVNNLVLKNSLRRGFG